MCLDMSWRQLLEVKHFVRIFCCGFHVKEISQGQGVPSKTIFNHLNHRPLGGVAYLHTYDKVYHVFTYFFKYIAYCIS